MRRVLRFARVTPEAAAFGAAVFAVVLWGTLPVLRLQAAGVPPLLMTAIALAAAALMETLRGWLVAAFDPLDITSAPALPLARGAVLAATLVGAIGFYFLGLDRAPAARVTLVTYVWPLLFVVAAEVLAHGRVPGLVLAGCAVAFGGSAALIGDGAGGVARAHALGYLAGLASGACWVVYSLTLRRGPAPGPDAWPRVFTLGAVGAAVLHLLTEPAVWPLSAGALAVCAAIGVGPYGLAFVAWAHGVRCGPARTVGALAYAVPFVASAALIALGDAEPSLRLGLGALTILGGVLLAGRRSAAG